MKILRILSPYYDDGRNNRDQVVIALTQYPQLFITTTIKAML